MSQKYVAYYRVSTAKQGRSGLGLDAQEVSVSAFIASRAADAKLLASFTEVESGKRVDRPELVKAMERARLTGAALLIAKIDRLSRDVHFLTGLQKAGLRFVAADMPDANEMTVQIMVVVAQNERKVISARTKAALQAAKARGTRLGNPNGAAHLRGRGNGAAVEAIKLNAVTRASGLRTTILELRAAGTTSASGIAKALHQQEIVTPRGGKWTARSVQNVMKRL